MRPPRICSRGVGRRCSQGRQKRGRWSMEFLVIDGEVMRVLQRLPLQHQERDGNQEQRSILIRHFGQKQLRRQLVFDVSVCPVVFVMIRMSTEILEMHEIRRFLAVKTYMVMNVPGATEHQ